MQMVRAGVTCSKNSLQYWRKVEINDSTPLLILQFKFPFSTRYKNTGQKFLIFQSDFPNFVPKLFSNLF